METPVRYCEPIERQMYGCICRGLFDSVALHRCLIVTMKSKTIRTKLVQCLLLNGVIFLGSIFVYSYFVSPILVWALRILFSRGAGTSDLVEMISTWIEWLYYSVWIIPVYVLSFVLNTLWYQDIANEAMRIYPVAVVVSGGTSSVTGRIAEAIYRVIFSIVFLVFLTVIVRYRLLYLIYLSYFISLNAFEFRYKSLKDRINLIERNWLYFFSFGFPLSLLVVQFPTLIENGLVSLLFPFLLMTASTGSKPVGVTLTGGNFFFGWVEKLRIFSFIELLTNILVWCITLCTKRSN